MTGGPGVHVSQSAGVDVARVGAGQPSDPGDSEFAVAGKDLFYPVVLPPGAEPVARSDGDGPVDVDAAVSSPLGKWFP